MGFDDMWLRWIGFCIKAVRFSILVNAEPLALFLKKRRLSQGDLLSPFLFIIAMVGLNSMPLAIAWIKGFKVCNRI